MATTTLPARVTELLERNQGVVDSWSQPPNMVQLRAQSRKNDNTLIVLSCMDPRASPAQFFDSPDLPVLRNAGGRAAPDVVRSLVVLRTLAALKTVLVVHHEDCGLTHLTDSEISGDAKQRTPSAAAVAEIDAMTYGSFKAEDEQKVLKDDVLALRASPSLEGVEVLAMWLDLKTGKISHVEV